MKLQKISALFSALLIVLISPCRGSDFKNFVINPEHSIVEFEISYMSLSSVKGNFERFQGHYKKDLHLGVIKDLYFEIEIESINTRDKKRDQHLISSDFFDSRRFSVITFEQVGKVQSIQEGVPLEIKGLLTIKDHEQTTNFNFQYLGKAQDQMGREAHFYEAQTQINRQDYGLNWNQLIDSGGWVIGDTVNIKLTIESFNENQRPAYSRFFRPSQRQLQAPESLKRPEQQRNKDQVAKLSQRIDKMSEQIVALRNKKNDLKKENRQLKEKLNSSKSGFSSIKNASIQWNLWIIYFVLFLIPIIMFIAKKRFHSVIVKLDGPLFQEEINLNLSKKALFWAEWLFDTGIFYTIVLILGLILLWIPI